MRINNWSSVERGALLTMAGYMSFLAAYGGVIDVAGVEAETRFSHSWTRVHTVNTNVLNISLKISTVNIQQIVIYECLSESEFT